MALPRLHDEREPVTRGIYVSHEQLDRQKAVELLTRAANAVLDHDTEGLASALLFTSLAILTIARLDTTERARNLATQTIRNMMKGKSR